jgi:hypothetical protein
MSIEIAEIITVPSREFQRKIDLMQMASWVNQLAPWTVMTHQTWRDKVFHYRDGSEKLCGVKLDTARRYYEKFMAKNYSRISYFYAVEENPSRDGHHIHSLLADAKSLYRKEMWSLWFEKFGRNKVEPVHCLQDVVDYCAKYVCKEGAWWNVKLQWHRIQAINDPGFVLRLEDSGGSKNE